MNVVIRLLPCPFCGKEAHVVEPQYQGAEFQIQCSQDEDEGCPATPFVDGETYEKAAALWNQRARSSPPLDEQPLTPGHDIGCACTECVEARLEAAG